ncbi:MAG TPA: hypothetical protein VLX92_04600 [Kofleriaceae bacterium]|nr:hypothetical protein [Kofleriaceae bacterium]
MKLSPVAAIALFATSATARAQGVSADHTDVSGQYDGTFGHTELHQDGTHVAGSYAYDDGRIDGTLDGTTLRFAWTEDHGSGQGVFQVGGDGSLAGTWGNGASTSDGGAWTLAPARAAPGQPRGLFVGFRMPWDFAAGGGNLTVGMAGLGVDLGKRVGARGYLGISAEDELMMNIKTDRTDYADDDPTKLINRIRLGLEVRDYFHEGQASVRVNCGPETPVPRHDWVGARVGAETLDGLGTVGGFGDVSIGWDAQLGGAQLGMYLSAGVSVEPATAYGTTMPAPSLTALATTPPPTTGPSSGIVVEGDLAFGIRFQGGGG